MMARLESAATTVASKKALYGIAEKLRKYRFICCTLDGADGIEVLGRRSVEMEMSEGPVSEKLRGFTEPAF